MNTRIKIYIRCSGQRFDLYSKKDGDIGLEIGDDYFGSIFQYYDNNTEEYEECWVLRGVIRAIRSEREKYEISEEVKDNQVLHIQVANIIENMNLICSSFQRFKEI